MSLFGYKQLCCGPALHESEKGYFARRGGGGALPVIPGQYPPEGTWVNDASTKARGAIEALSSGRRVFRSEPTVHMSLTA